MVQHHPDGPDGGGDCDYHGVQTPAAGRPGGYAHNRGAWLRDGRGVNGFIGQRNNLDLHLRDPGRDFLLHSCGR